MFEHYPRHKTELSRKIISVVLLVFFVGVTVFAQYSGAPVKKDRLIRALRSKQLQSQDIVAVIRSNGVDFMLTAEVRISLIAAGARPEVIQAVASNRRTGSFNGATYARKGDKNFNRRSKPNGSDYSDLLEKAMYSYQEQKNTAGAIRYLQTAIKMKPRDAMAYQMMGFVSLYGLDNLEDARRYMKESISNGGSAIFRVYHDDSGNFTSRCAGSLYISPETIRFESDDNIHTFETSTVNVQSVKPDTESSKLWKRYPIFSVNLKFGKEKAKFRFAPITGAQAESNMAAYFISESRLSNSKIVSVASN